MNALATVDRDMARDMARVVESLVLRGDISALTPTERATYYMQTCEGLGLNPHSHPFAFLKLNGKEVMYATRGATDQLAAQARVNREIIDGPKVIDLAGTKLVYALCRATLPNGRFETSVATVPLTDPVNVLMKCETKAKRRATLSILGLGLLDEVELETIPENVKEPGGGVDISLAKPRGLNPPPPEPQRDEEPENDPDASVGSKVWAAFVAAVPTLRTAAAVAERYIALPQDLREEGEQEPEKYLSDKDGPGALSMAREVLARLGHRLAKDESATVVQNLELASLLDTQTTVATLMHAVAWWRAQRATAKEMGPKPAEVLFYALGRRLASELTPTATKAAVKSLKLAVEAADKGPGPGGPGGAPKPAASQNTAANGGAAAGSQGAGATMLVTPEVREWREYLKKKSWRGTDQGAAGVAGSYWKHCTGEGELASLPAVQRSLVFTSTLDELTERGIAEPHSFLNEIGVKNGALVREQAA